MVMVRMVLVTGDGIVMVMVRMVVVTGNGDGDGEDGVGDG